MKITFKKDGLLIQSPFGEISGDSLLHYAVAKILSETVVNVKETFPTKDTDRVLEFTHPIEEEIE